MEHTISLRMAPAAWIQLLILSLLWGGSFFFIGVAVKTVPPTTLAFLRVGIACLTLHLVLASCGQYRFKLRSTWWAFLVMGALNNAIPFILIMWSETRIASGLASILNATTPLFTVLVAHAFTRDERLTPIRLLGVLLGFVGVILIVGPGLLKGLTSNSMAQFACVGAAISYAFAGVFGRRFKALGLHPMTTAAGQLTASSALLGPMALWVDYPWHLATPGFTTWSAILSLALFSTALAYILYFRILSTSGATNLLLVTFLIPVSAIFLGIFFLGEHLRVEGLMGFGLIACGLVVIDGRLLKFWGLSPTSEAQ